MGTGGMVGGTPILNFELIPHHKNFKWFVVGGTAIKISNWDDKIIKIKKNLPQFHKKEKNDLIFVTPHHPPA